MKLVTLKNQTAQSRYYWDLIEQGLTHVINWKIIKKILFDKKFPW